MSAKGLRENSYAVDIAIEGDEAAYMASINLYDLFVLDINLPKKDGFEVCLELRENGNKKPILMLTARDAIDDRISGLDIGADDYLTKPFEFRELLARLRAVVSKAERVSPAKDRHRRSRSRYHFPERKARRTADRSHGKGIFTDRVSRDE